MITTLRLRAYDTRILSTVYLIKYDCNAVCLSMPSNLPSHAFFLDVIYDKNTSLSISPKYTWPIYSWGIRYEAHDARSFGVQGP